MEEKRHKCVICGRVRYENKMHRVFNLWTCKYDSYQNIRYRFISITLKNGFYKMLHPCTYKSIKNQKLAIDNKSLIVNKEIEKHLEPDFNFYAKAEVL